jgi:hypothetical protein
VNFDRVLRSSQLYNLLIPRKEPEPGVVFLSQRRVYILPTRQGLTFCLALLVMLIGSINYNLSLGYVLTFLLAGVGIVSILHTFRNLAHLYISPGRVEPVFSGNDAHFQLHIENRNHHERFAIALNRAGVTTGCDIAPASTVSVTLIIPTQKRGLMPIGRVTFDTRYPLGLLRAWSYVSPDLHCLVYPQPDTSRLPPLQAQANSGDTVALGTGTDDFFGLRPYQPGDSRCLEGLHARRTAANQAVQRTGGGTDVVQLERPAGGPGHRGKDVAPDPLGAAGQRRRHRLRTAPARTGNPHRRGRNTLPRLPAGTRLTRPRGVTRG